MDTSLKIALIGAIALIIAALIKLVGDLIYRGSPRSIVLTITALILGLSIVGAILLFGRANPPSLVTITVTNNNCVAQDFFVDGSKVLSAIQPGAIEAFQSTAWQHATYVCTPGTNSCANPQQADWTSERITTIGRASYCGVTITLANNNCVAQDFYVDGNKVLSAIPPSTIGTFVTTAGLHATYACVPGTNSCANPQQTDWTSKRITTIGRGSYCP